MFREEEINFDKFYETLGAQKTDPIEKIHKRYLQLVKYYHPDKYTLNLHKKWATEKFLEIDTAYKSILEIKRNEKERGNEAKLAFDILNQLKNREEFLKEVDKIIREALKETVYIVIGCVLFQIVAYFAFGKNVLMFGYILPLFLIPYFYVIWRNRGD